jgi:hypothetical protein
VEGEAVHHHHNANLGLSGDHEHHTDKRELHLAGRNVSDAAIVDGHWWHLHFQLLGFEFTLPEPASDQGDGESRSKDAVPVLASGQDLLPCQTAQSASAQQVIRSSTFSSPGDAAPMQVVVSAPPPVSCAPLCDIARRERSGVLLA